MDLQEAADNFARVTTHCDNLIAVHRGYGGPGQGRRHEEVSINRAVVVLVVASWQSAIQDYTLACLELSTPPPGGPLTRASFAVLAGRVKNEVRAFSTPNAENVQKLMTGAGFDPQPHWAWSQHAGQGQGVKMWTAFDAAKRMNEWVQIRHAIAHGHYTLPPVEALQAVRQSPGGRIADPQLRLVDAEQCLAFFRRLVRLTSGGLAAHLGLATP